MDGLCGGGKTQRFLSSTTCSPLRPPGTRYVRTGVRTPKQTSQSQNSNHTSGDRGERRRRKKSWLRPKKSVKVVPLLLSLKEKSNDNHDLLY